MLREGADFRRFLFLSPDFIVDGKGRVYLEEMNTNGFMPGDDVLYKMQKVRQAKPVACKSFASRS